VAAAESPVGITRKSHLTKLMPSGKDLDELDEMVPSASMSLAIRRNSDLAYMYSDPPKSLISL
jgi:hypothetical protein